MLRSILMSLALLLPLAASATIQQVPTVAYTGLNFTVSGGTDIGYLAACNALNLNATGDFAVSKRFTANGIFNCGNPNQAYPVTGSGYLTTNAMINMNVTVGILMWVCTISSTTFNGSCTVITYSGNELGTVNLTFVP